MSLGDDLKKLFSRKKTLDKITVDELRRERVRLEQRESKMIKEIEDVEKRKQSLFLKGKDEASQRQQVIMARKIKELDSMSRTKDKQLALYSRQLRVISGFEQIKQNRKEIEEMGMTSILNKMDLSELQTYVEKAVVEGGFQMEKLKSILDGLEGSDMAGDFGEDPDIMKIVEAMQEAKAAENTSDTEVAVDQGLKKVDKILQKEDKSLEE